MINFPRLLCVLSLTSAMLLGAPASYADKAKDLVEENDGTSALRKASLKEFEKNPKQARSLAKKICKELRDRNDSREKNLCKRLKRSARKQFEKFQERENEKNRGSQGTVSPGESAIVP